MNLSAGQKITILVFIGLYFAMYLGCDTTSKEIQMLEKSRTVNPYYINIQAEIMQAKSQISSEDRLALEELELDVEQSMDDEKIEGLKKIASKWYNIGLPLLSGYYAEQIAEIENTEDAWALAGTTNFLSLSTLNSEKHLKYAQQHAIDAFEKAISLNPQNLDHKINKALCYVEDKENPMQGIMMLRELESENPDAPAVQMQLGRLSLRTNQLDKALERFNKVIQLDPANKDAHCLLAEVYKEKNDKSGFEKHSAICQLR